MIQGREYSGYTDTDTNTEEEDADVDKEGGFEGSDEEDARNPGSRSLCFR